MTGQQLHPFFSSKRTSQSHTRTCHSCHKDRPVPCFSKNQIKKYRIRARCKDCVQEDSAKLTPPLLNEVSNLNSKDQQPNEENNAKLSPSVEAKEGKNSTDEKQKAIISDKKQLRLDSLSSVLMLMRKKREESSHSSKVRGTDRRSHQLLQSSLAKKQGLSFKKRETEARKQSNSGSIAGYSSESSFGSSGESITDIFSPVLCPGQKTPSQPSSASSSTSGALAATAQNATSSSRWPPKPQDTTKKELSRKRPLLASSSLNGSMKKPKLPSQAAVSSNLKISSNASSRASAESTARPSSMCSTKPFPSKVIPSHKAQRISQLGDGNCLYRSLAYGLNKLQHSSSSRGQTHHQRQFVRSSFYKKMKGHRELREILASWVLKNAKRKFNGAEILKWIKWEKHCDVRRYYEQQRNNHGAWGGQIELCACSNLFKVTVNVFEYDKKRRVYKRTSSFIPEAFSETTGGSGAQTNHASHHSNSGSNSPTVRNRGTNGREQVSSFGNVNVLYVHGNHYDALELR